MNIRWPNIQQKNVLSNNKLKSRLFKASVIAVSVTSVLASLNSSAGVSSTSHKDFRKYVKLDVQPSFERSSSSQISLLKGEVLASEYLTQNQEKYSLTSFIDNLKLKKIQPSLSATHYHFQQYLNGIEVDKAEIIVSVSTQNQVTRVFNNTFPVLGKTVSSTQNVIKANTASKKVWNYLQVVGKLQLRPKTQLVYVNQGRNFKLAYKVNMTVSQPTGDWEFYIDANTSNVIQAYRVDLPISKNANARKLGGKWQPFAANKNHKSFDKALSELAQSQKAKNFQSASRADATALVFDPDPRTTLNDETIQDTTPATSFDAAYLSRILQDVTLNAGTYSLVGPWVTIEDWDPPTNAPSTTTDGNWSAKRGDNSFNDAMTYFHVDQNQRYIQSLGFTGSTGIQFTSIGVDTDGANGDDQSYFQPGSNKMSFGHGCVDDNEDADVILHEYGHAINHSINSNFSGGDTGAMGEGFGDYWAVSYSYSTPNGRSFRPEWVFSWDGHSSCWPGRLVNQTGFRYDPGKTYGAHDVVDGVLGDELWSTPLTQSLIELLDAGVSRNEVDQIILEAQFGLGSGLTMTDMATAIVNAANQLYPSGQHAEVFAKHFKTMNILSAPLEAQEVAIVSAGNNTVADPGEVVTFNIPLRNKGTATVTQISAALSTTAPNVAIGGSTSNYSDLAVSASANNDTLYELTLPASQVCGDDVSLSMTANYTEGTADSSVYDVILPVGATGNQNTTTSTPAVSIPDNNSTGITDTIVVSGAAAGSSISVDMDVSHTYRGDLTITLTSPAGTSVTLRSESNDGTANIIGNFPDDFAPVESLSVFDNEDHDGTWTLKIVDGAAQDTGTLNSWKVISTAGAVCNGTANAAPTASVSQANITVSEGGNVSLDASSSSDPDGDSLTYTWSQTTGGSVTLSNASSATASFVAPSVTAATTLGFEVTVTDPTGASDTATVSVTVNDVPDTSGGNNNNGNDEGGGGGSLGWLSLGILGLLRKRKAS